MAPQSLPLASVTVFETLYWSILGFLESFWASLRRAFSSSSRHGGIALSAGALFFAAGFALGFLGSGARRWARARRVGTRSRGSAGGGAVAGSAEGVGSPFAGAGSSAGT